MHTAQYGEMIKALPEADIPLDGVRAWLAQGKRLQIAFFEIEPIGAVPEHSHGEQWGIVVEGEMELTIGGEAKRYGPGDSYHIPAGVPHSAKFLSFFRTIDVFADADRYKPKG